MHQIVIFKLNLFKSCIKEHDLNLQQFPATVIHASELFLGDPADKLWMKFISYYAGYMLTGFWAWQKCMQILLYLVQSKYTKISKQFCLQTNALDFFCVLLQRVFVWSSRKVWSSIYMWYKHKILNLEFSL